MTRARLARAAAVIALTLAFMAVLGRVRWPEPVGLFVSRLSGALGGRGIEETEDLFLLLCLAASLLVAIGLVALVGRRRVR